MSHLETLLMNELRKPLQQLEKTNVGYIDGETSSRIYYTIDNHTFAVEIREVKDIKSELHR